ncbi:MAG: HAD-IA family hydrolase [Dongiaceae bacterium]
MRLTDFTTMTFDVFGTLIDFETGVLNWLRPRVKPQGADDAHILERFARAEANLIDTDPNTTFMAMLPPIYRALAADLGLPDTPTESEAFRQSMANWPPFPDSNGALAYLRQHYRLVAATNGDNWGVDHMSRALGEPFHDRVTAEDVGRCKPDPQVFAFLRGRLSAAGIKTRDILHVAQSQYHDIGPAKQLGFATCWINRRHGKQGFGGTPAPERHTEPDFFFTSMAELAAVHRAALAETS